MLAWWTWLPSTYLVDTLCLISAIQQAIGHCSVFRGIPHKRGERRRLLETIFPTDCATTLSTPVQCPFLSFGFDTTSGEVTAHKCLLRHPRWDRYGWLLLNQISWPFSQHARWVTLGYCSHFALIRSKMAELVGLAIPSKLKFTSKLLTPKKQGLKKNPPELPGPFCFRDTSLGRGVET